MLAWIGALIFFACYAAIVPASPWLHLCDDPRNPTSRSRRQSPRSSASISRKQRSALSRTATIR